MKDGGKVEREKDLEREGERERETCTRAMAASDAMPPMPRAMNGGAPGQLPSPKKRPPAARKESDPSAFSKQSSIS